MATVILVIHLLIALALVGTVLLQRSEGGGLGMSSGGGGFMTGRGQANLLTRTTAVLAAAFFTTSILLSILAQTAVQPRSVLEQLDTSAPAKSSGTAAPAPGLPPLTLPGATDPPAAPVTPAAPAAPAPPKSR